MKSSTIVQIVKEDLSEMEALDIEAALVERWGGCAADGGTLANWVPGGELAGVELGIEIQDGGWSAAYEDARTFKDVHGEQQQAFIRALNDELDGILCDVERFQEEAEEYDDDTLSSNVVDLDCIIGSLQDAAVDLLRRRVSWEDFALTLEETVDDLEFELADIANYDEKVHPLLKRGYHITKKALSRIDSGNRKEAEKGATELTSRDNPPVDFHREAVTIKAGRQGVGSTETTLTTATLTGGCNGFLHCNSQALLRHRRFSVGWVVRSGRF